MDKIKNFLEKNKKILVILLGLLLLLLLILTRGFGLFGSNNRSSKIGKYDLSNMDSYSYIWNFKNGEELTVFGQVTNLDSEYFFYLRGEDEENILIYYSDLNTGKRTADIGNLKSGDYAIIEGVWDINNTAIVASKITQISEKVVTDFRASQIPMLDIQIIDYPKNIEHACETLKFKLRLKNVGQIPISHGDLYNRSYVYGIFFFIDDDYRIANSDREDYELIKEELDDYTQVGLLSNEGFLYFDEIAPGKSVEVEYWGGGKVTESLYSDLFNDDGTNRRAGIGGEHNIFSRKAIGSHSFYFSWVKKSSWEEPEFLLDSNKVEINLIDNECYATEDNITDTFMIAPL